MIRSYAGIGSRSTPYDVLQWMTQWARFFSFRNVTLRSGSARGADTAFEDGAGHLKQIFTAEQAEDRPDWHELAKRYHPAWNKCSPYARLLHARNGPIVMGENLDDPVDCVICWTPGGEVTGGTGQAPRIALDHEIPIFNIGKPETHERLVSWLTPST